MTNLKTKVMNKIEFIKHCPFCGSLLDGIGKETKQCTKEGCNECFIVFVRYHTINITMTHLETPFSITKE